MQTQSQQTANQVIETNKQAIFNYLTLDDQWKFESDNKGTKLWIQKEPQTGLNMSRVSTQIAKPIAVVSQYFDKVENYKASDSSLIDAKMLEQFDSDFYIGYLQIKLVTGMDNRDICFVQKRSIEGDRVVIIRGNYQHSSTPVPKGYTRANLVISGFVLTQVDENTTEMVAIMCLDPSGNVPDFIKKKGATKQYEMVENIKSFIEKQ